MENTQFLLGKLQEATTRIDNRLKDIDEKLDKRLTSTEKRLSSVEKNQNKILGGFVIIPVLFTVITFIYKIFP